VTIIRSSLVAHDLVKSAMDTVSPLPPGVPLRVDDLDLGVNSGSFA
jgi:hypothetical protein